MTEERLELMFSGYCAVSGSPVSPHDYNRYRHTLPLVSGGNRTGYMHYCCWPCVCDTQDFIHIDTKTIDTANGPRQYHFAVLGNACDNAEMLTKPFMQAFGHGRTTLKQSAPEVRCGSDGTLLGATLSDHGFPIINMFFDAVTDTQPSRTDGPSALATQYEEGSLLAPLPDPTPGRISKSKDGVSFSDEREWEPMCSNRAANGYNSGMGEIFRKVAGITPIPFDIVSATIETATKELPTKDCDLHEGECKDPSSLKPEKEEL